MADLSGIEPQTGDLGGTPVPAFAVAPDPETMFEARAARLRTLAAAGGPLADYLLFLAELAQAQHDLQPGLPEPVGPDEDAIERAFSFGMPPLDRARFEVDLAAAETFDRLLERAAGMTMPEGAAAARDRLAGDPDLCERTLLEALDAPSPAEGVAEHVFASAALQVHFARLAARLDAYRLTPVSAGACPCCGGPPLASLVVGWPVAHGLRYVACSLCGVLWNHVRARCVACETSAGVGYRSLEVEDGDGQDGPGEVEPAPIAQAETCDECGGYVKILHQHLDPGIDPLADDVATLGLDAAVREAGWRRASFNPFLLGY